MKIKDFICHIKTASGEKEPVLGYVEAPVTFQNKTKTIVFYLVPTISQKMILGCNFWEAFGLKEKFLGFINAITPATPDPEKHILNDEQQAKLDLAIDKFKCFSKHCLGKTHLEVHSIDTGDSVPIKQKHYPVSPPVQELMYAELDRMLGLGVIEVSDSAWSSPVTLRRKPGKNRLCLDARKLNDCTTKDAYPLPHIEGLLSRLEDTHYISSVRGFLGMTGWYRMFIKDYATIAAPLSNNLRKGPKKFVFSDESLIAFEKSLKKP